jgi:transitional endoplasmic reticulum ATPase
MQTNLLLVRQNAAVAHSQTWSAALLLAGMTWAGAITLIGLSVTVKLPSHSGAIGLWLLLFFNALMLSFARSMFSTNISYVCRALWLGIVAYMLSFTWRMLPFFEAELSYWLSAKTMEGNLAAFNAFQIAPEVATATTVGLAFYYTLMAGLAIFMLLILSSTLLQIKKDRIEGITLVPERDFYDIYFTETNQAQDHTHQSQPGHVTPESVPNNASGYHDQLKTRDTEARKSDTSFMQIIGNDAFKKKLLEAANAWKTSGKNGILLHGEPGTGKTVFANALAGELKLPILAASINSVNSRFVGQSNEHFLDVLDSAIRQAPCVLFIDELEVVLPDRDNLSAWQSEDSKRVAAFLAYSERLRKSKVLLIAATNYKEKLDAAAIREGRFDFHIEVPLPDSEARRGIMQTKLKEVGKKVDNATLDKLVVRWSGFSAKRLQEAVERAAKLASSDSLVYTDFKRGLRDVQGAASSLSEYVPDLKDLYFDNEVKRELELLGTQFRKIDEIEALGGSVPKGIIFYGPPGTGKTTMAQSLAKAAEFTFIATSGKELMENGDALKKLRRKASDLRPAMVFIDEADDILGDRQFSGHKMQTNELLQTIDGAGKPLPDVVWVLATNHIDGFDEAVYRRFPKKIELALPGREVIENMVLDFAQRYEGRLSIPVQNWVEQVVPLLEGLAPSAVKGILEGAHNQAIVIQVATLADTRISPEFVVKARKEMML